MAQYPEHLLLSLYQAHVFDVYISFISDSYKTLKFKKKLMK